MANKFFGRRTFVLLALVALSILAGKAGHPCLPHGGFGMWDGPI